MPLFKRWGSKADNQSSSAGIPAPASSASPTVTATTGSVDTSSIPDDVLFDLTKEAPELIDSTAALFDLTKEHGVTHVVGEVDLWLDWSGSTEFPERRFYSRRVMHRTVARFMPPAMWLDSNKRLDLGVYSEEAVDCGDLGTADEHWRNAVDNAIKVYKKQTRSGQGRTFMLKALKLTLNRYAQRYSVANGGWMEPNPGGIPRLVRPAKTPLVSYFLGDGDPNEQDAIIRFLENTSELPWFIQCVGLGDEEFPFFHSLNDRLHSRIDHVGFAQVVDVDSMSDQDLYREVVLGEFAIRSESEPNKPAWIEVASDPKNGLIVPMAA